MFQSTYIKKVSIEAFVLASSVTKLLGTAGIPASILLGTMPTLLQLFGADESEKPLTVQELRSATDEILSRITEASLLSSARDAAGKIQGTYGWYRDEDARARAGTSNEELFRSEIREALGPNSQLRQGLAVLSNPQVGKFDCTHYALGAGLFVKLLVVDIAEHPSREMSSAWSVVAANVNGMQATLHSLLNAADFEMGMQLKKWRSGHPRASNAEWLAQRDKLLDEIVGGAENLDNLKSVKNELMRQSGEAQQKAAQALDAELHARVPS